MSALEQLPLGTLQVMRKILASRRNDSSYEHDQSDQLCAIDAEIEVRARRRDAQFSRLVERAQ